MVAIHPMPRLVVAAAIALLTVCRDTASAYSNDGVAALIDKLPGIANGDLGYMPTRSGGGFLPLAVSRPGAMLLFQLPPTKSEALRELVERGAAAVPDLIAHLDDKRPTKIELKFEGGFGGIFFDDEYDYNSRVIKQPPVGVNRNSFREHEEHPNHHTVTVGDLCFVALGQIFNRSFSAVRYQPTACTMINSPTYSERLRLAVKVEWGNLTPKSHRERLIRDFVEADSESRREGACLRLGFYYRDALEPLALRQLAQPRYEIADVDRLIREHLYRAGDPKDRKTKFDHFISKHNEVARQGVLKELFDDLDLQEHGERGEVSPPIKPGEYLARECLIELFAYPKALKSTDRPFLLPLSDSAQARYIDALSYFPSPKIDQSVRDILHSTDDDYLARACVRFLVGRGADADIRKYVEKRLPRADERRRAELEQLSNQIGWTPLHVAAETYENDKLEALIRAGADINARAANGQTPLHVAAAHGSYGGIRILLHFKANPNLKDNCGRTPVQFALAYHPDAVDDLLAGGAEISDILVAASAGRDDLVKRFLEKDKAAVNARVAATGDTALHLASLRGRTKVAEVLLAHGADVNAVDGSRSKLTPLHRAATFAPAELVKLLLAHNADPNAKSWDGKTPKDFAHERRDEQILRLFDK
jgi:ankyrin repeat protein